jgi:hypothetical protein
MEGTDYRYYTSRFLEISGLIPDFTGTESKRIDRFIWGAHPDVRPNMCKTKPRTMQEAIETLAEVTEEIIRSKGSRGNDGGVKTKYDGSSSGERFGKSSKGNKRFVRGGFKARKVEPKGGDDKDPSCYKCGIKGHLARDCNKTVTCFSCGLEGHVKTKYTKLNKNTSNNRNDKGKGTGTSGGNPECL